MAASATFGADGSSRTGLARLVGAVVEVPRVYYLESNATVNRQTYNPGNQAAGTWSTRVTLRNDTFQGEPNGTCTFPEKGHLRLRREGAEIVKRPPLTPS